VALPIRQSVVEESWPLGEHQAGAVELEPVGSAQTITGLLGDDGLAVRRGGVTRKSNAAVGSAGLLALWSGRLLPGTRTLYHTFSNALGGTSTVTRLGSDDATPGTLLALVFGGGTGSVSRMVTVDDKLVIPLAAQAGLATLYVYGGSFKTADYSTGTVTVTQDSTAVTGAGTAWGANVDAGMLFRGPDSKVIVVQSVSSDTTLTLAQPYTGATAAGAAYFLSPTLSPTLAYTGSAGTEIIASVASRLAYVDRSNTTRLYFSTIGSLTLSSTDYHQFSAGIVGLAPLHDTLLVFTSAGVYAVSNMAYDLTDPSGNALQRKDLVNADLIAWGHEGIAPWKGSIVVPGLDGVWLMDGVSAPTRISTHIQDLYLGYVRTSGYKPGVAEVYNGHYFLPILTSANVWVDTLVCRLQPTHEGANFSWSQLDGNGAKVTAYAERSSNPPLLLGASTLAASRVLEATGYFSPTATIKGDVMDPLSNPGFETNTTGWVTNVPAFWLNAGATLTRDTGTFRSGVASGKVVTASGTAFTGTSFSYTPTNGFVAGQTYSVDVWLKGNAGGESLYLFLGDASLDSGRLNFTATNGWAQYSVKWTPLANFATAYIGIGSNDTTAHTFFIDDVLTWSVQSFRLTTRNYKVGDRPTAVMSLLANYSLVDGGTDNPTITAEASVDGGAYTTLTVATGTDSGTTAGDQDGSQTVYWEVLKAGRYVRFRFTCTAPAASLQFKRLEFRYRPRGN
jgi:hypothetical protein